MIEKLQNDKRDLEKTIFELQESIEQGKRTESEHKRHVDALKSEIDQFKEDRTKTLNIVARKDTEISQLHGEFFLLLLLLLLLSFRSVRSDLPNNVIVLLSILYI